MDFTKLYIDGAWVTPKATQQIEVLNPATQQVIAAVPAASAADTDVAVQAAYKALPNWAATPLADRIKLMDLFLVKLKELGDDMTMAITQELGSPVAFSKAIQVDYQYVRIASYIELAAKAPLVEKLPQSTVYRDPVGVVACITPWNYPLGQIVQKVIPAVLMGNTVVLKPSQHTPLAAYYLTEAFHRAGFPKGVVNLVTGRGGEVGNALTDHPLVSMISFTGSTSAGVSVSQRALATMKRISMELGGKSPMIILPGTDGDSLAAAVTTCFNSIFLNSGQTCTALSRLLVPKAELDKIEKALLAAVPTYTVGDPLDPASKLGPMASKNQYDTVKKYIATGVEEGARLLCGGDLPEDKGYYIAPTIFSNVKNDMVIAQEEIFGPVLCVITYDTIDEAIAIANDTPYGLNAAVWGEKQQAIQVARRVKSGNVYINDGPRDVAAPFGGFKESGIGREGGLDGLLEFTEPQALFDAGTREA